MITSSARRARTTCFAATAVSVHLVAATWSRSVVTTSRFNSLRWTMQPGRAHCRPSEVRKRSRQQLVERTGTDPSPVRLALSPAATAAGTIRIGELTQELHADEPEGLI